MSFVETEHDPAPEGGVVDFLTASDQTRFRVARWCPEGATRGTVVILNGRTEFIEKYFEVVRDLIERGYAVATLDWRGQGLSQRALDNPHKGHVESFDRYVSDLRQAVQDFIRPHCPEPYRALAHSMGGNITLRYLGAHPDTFESAVFSAPMWGIGRHVRPPWWMRVVAKLSKLGMRGSYLPGSDGDYGESSTKFEDNVLTHDEHRFRRMVAQVAAEPKLALGAATIGWAEEAIASMDIVHDDGFPESIQIPVRVCSAGRDTLVSNESHVQLVERMPKGQHVVVEGAKHELLIEIEEYRRQIFAVFDSL